MAAFIDKSLALCLSFGLIGLEREVSQRHRWVRTWITFVCQTNVCHATCYTSLERYWIILSISSKNIWQKYFFFFKIAFENFKNCTGTPWFQDVRLGNARFKIYVFPKNTACVGLKTPKAALIDVCLLLNLSKTCLSRPKWPLFRRITSIFRRIRQLSSRVFSPNLSLVPWENLVLRMALRGTKKNGQVHGFPVMPDARLNFLPKTNVCQ